MTSPKPNAELAYLVLDHIDAHPEQWDQGHWIGKAECGTAACFAGWAVLLSRAEPINFFTSWEGRDFTGKVVLDGRTQAVSSLAEKLLGANRWVDEGDEEESDLFGQYNTREDLGRLVAEIFGPRPVSGESR